MPTDSFSRSRIGRSRTLSATLSAKDERLSRIMFSCSSSLSPSGNSELKNGGRSGDLAMIGEIGKNGLSMKNGELSMKLGMVENESQSRD